MKQLTINECQLISAGLHLKLHFNVFQAIFTVIGAGILGGPVGAGVAIGGLIGAQGLGNLHEMVQDEQKNKVTNET